MDVSPAKLYYIEWSDAMANISSWISEEDAIDWAESSEGVVRQVGWLVKETDAYILLASRLGEINDGETDLGGVFKIPTPWILKKEEITFSS